MVIDMTLRKLPRMPKWRVRQYQDGVWNEIAPMLVEADTPLAAAEMIAGAGIRSSGPDGAYCIAVWLAGNIPDPVYFWAAPAVQRPAVQPNSPGQTTPTQRTSSSPYRQAAALSEAAA